MRATYLGSFTSRTFIFVGVALALNACMVFRRPPSAPQAYERTQTSAAGMYRATFAPVGSIKVGRLHTWQLQVTTIEGAPVTDAKFVVDGGMPQHGHGLPTKPIVSRFAGESYALVEGMKFNMGGWWVVKLHIDGSKGSDIVTFNLKL